MEQGLRNMTSTTFLYQMRDLWKSPRGTVLRIEAVMLVTIVVSFFLAAFGSCRRWSNRWVIQKGFFAANALYLPLGTYCIGLMQSSSVKSKMYPIWGVSLLTLLGCIDPITSYSLEYKSLLWKMLFQICLYCGYVVLISISSISRNMDTIAIGALSAITFIKGFHRSLAFVLRSRTMQTVARRVEGHMVHLSMEENVVYRTGDLHGYRYIVQWYLEKEKSSSGSLSFGRRAKSYHLREITIDEIFQCEDYDVSSCKYVCLSLSLSHLLQRRFYGLTCAESKHQMTHDFVFKGLLLDYKSAFKVIEVELAFLYDVFFSSNAFLHFFQAEAASLWAFASVVGICFVGAVALNPGMRGSSHTSGSTIVVETSTADLIITAFILALLAFLQMLQLIWCWTSNWARAALVCKYMKYQKEGIKRTAVMRLRGLLSRINFFDNYLWENKLRQYSFIESQSKRKPRLLRGSMFMGSFCRKFGFPYIVIVLRDMWGRETSQSHAIELHDDVKEYIAEFLYNKNGQCSKTYGSTVLDENGLVADVFETWGSVRCVANVLAWHIGTCYCELAQRKKGASTLNQEECKYQGVATALSKYYAYLLVSAPQLVCKDSEGAKASCDGLAREASGFLCGEGDKLEAMRELIGSQSDGCTAEDMSIFRAGVQLGKQLEGMTRCWKILADFWVEALLYAAPSDDNAEEHIRRLSQGGEFITHLWALLSHAGILNRQADDEEEASRLFNSRFIKKRHPVRRFKRHPARLAVLFRGNLAKLFRGRGSHTPRSVEESRRQRSGGEADDVV